MKYPTVHGYAGNRKRSLGTDEDCEVDDSEMQSRKTTLHLENQERAYVAASRRTDRSLEARFQSALMASEVHKKRTGKNFRITHQIVRDEEMYEEEEQGLHACSPRSGYRGRTLSQTDAFISALIARKSGVQNFFEHNPVLFASPPLSGAASAGQVPSTTPYNSSSAPLIHQPTGYSSAGDNLAYSPGLEAYYAASTLPDEMGLDLGVSSSTFPDMIPHAHTFSDGSSMSDLSSYDSNYTFGSTTGGRASSSDSSDLRLEDCLADTDGENDLHFSQNGLAVGHDQT